MLCDRFQESSLRKNWYSLFPLFLSPSIIPTDWNAEVMVGAQATILDIRWKLHFEDGQATKYKELGFLLMEMPHEPQAAYIWISFLWETYVLLFYVFCHSQQNSVFTYTVASYLEYPFSWVYAVQPTVLSTICLPSTKAFIKHLLHTRQCGNAGETVRNKAEVVPALNNVIVERKRQTIMKWTHMYMYLQPMTSATKEKHKTLCDQAAGTLF